MNNIEEQSVSWPPPVIMPNAVAELNNTHNQQHQQDDVQVGLLKTTSMQPFRGQTVPNQNQRAEYTSANRGGPYNRRELPPMSRGGHQRRHYTGAARGQDEAYPIDGLEAGHQTDAGGGLHYGRARSPYEARLSQYDNRRGNFTS